MTRTTAPFQYEPAAASELCKYCPRQTPGEGCEYFDARGICLLEEGRRDREHRRRYSQRFDRGGKI